MHTSHQTVGEVMQTDVTTVRADTSVRELASLLVREGISGAPVVDERSHVIGVASATDILRLASREPATEMTDAGASRARGAGVERPDGYYLDAGGAKAELGPLVLSLVPPAWMDARTVGDIMSSTCHCVRPKTTLPDLARLLLRLRIHRALVMEDRELRGIVSTFDVLRCLVGPSETFERDF